MSWLGANSFVRITLLVWSAYISFAGKGSAAGHSADRRATTIGTNHWPEGYAVLNWRIVC